MAGNGQSARFQAQHPVARRRERRIVRRNHRRQPVLAMHAVTDGLVRMFGPRTPWLKTLRNAGLFAVDRLPMIKRALAQPALR